MRFGSLVPYAFVLCALTTAGSSQVNNSRSLARPQVVGAANPDATTHFSVYLPLSNKAALEQLVKDQTDSTSPSYHKWLTPAEFKAQFGPSASDMAKLKKELKAAGFKVTAEHTQNIEVEGPAFVVEKVFNAQLQQVRMPKGNLRLAAVDHRFSLPAQLASLGAVIPEFQPQLLAHVHSEHLAGASTPLGTGTGSLNVRLSTAESWFYPNDMNQAYVFPSFTANVVPKTGGAPVQMTGAGASIGIVISSTISQTDIARAFNSTVSAGGVSSVQNFSGNTSLPVPAPVIVPVLGGSGAFNPNSDDAAEASLDTQMSLGTAPGAKEFVYDMPDLSDASIIAAYTQVNEENRVDVVSSSFGECELDYTAAYNGGTDFTSILLTFHNLFVQGNAQGITYVASSGDNGAAACVTAGFSNNPTNGTNFILGVENPADDPNVTAVGGTNLKASATPTTNDSAYNSENANYDPRVPAQFSVGAGTVAVGNNTWGSGGGYSTIFAKPSYQNVVNTGSNPGRAVPDVSLMMGGCPGDADLTAQDCTTLPRSAAIVWIGGAPNLLIGTSSSSPQMAGVIALTVELAGTRQGNFNPTLYNLSALQTAASGKSASLSQFYHRSITGNNNGYTVVPGQAFSEVLGNGTLFVKNFLQLQSVPAAGTPSTPTNP
jgi:subtilase family serine protease